MSAPLVSAIVLSHESERYIAEAIESVRAQTHPRMELVVVDNGSADRTREIAAGYEPDTFVRVNPNRGITPGRNMGLAAAQGDYLAFLDGDDVWAPDKTALQLEALGADPGLDYVLGGVEQFLDDAADPGLPERISVDLGTKPGRMLCAMLAPRRTWDAVGPWTVEVQTGDGLDWFLRAQNLGLREDSLPNTVLRRRIHGANTSLRRAADRDAWPRMLKRRLDERRAAEQGR